MRYQTLNKILPKLVLILISQLFCIYSQVLNSSILNINEGIPPHLYKFNIQPNQQFRGNLVCKSGTVDIDAYIYQQGRNLMSYSGYVIRYISSTICLQNIYFTTTVGGNYYLKVYPYLSTPHSRYFFYQFSVISSTAYTNFTTVGDQIDSNNRLYSTYIFNRKKEQTCIDYMIRYTAPIGIQTSIQFQSQSSSDQYTLQFNNTLGLTFEQTVTGIQGLGDWSIKVLYNTSKSYYNITPYTLQLLKIVLDQNVCISSCEAINTTWDNINLICKSTANNTNNIKNQTVISQKKSLDVGQIIGISVGVGVFAIILIMAFCVYRKVNKQRISPDIQKHEISSIQLDKKDYTQEECVICLQKQCNSILACGHLFHETCITQWLKKNKTCPFCRQATKKQKIKKIIKSRRSVQQPSTIVPLENTY